ncbi:hypothetical protein B0H16DRAFT_1735422 [Mycena metata]|uniref:Uncharacterized protein n=1 Tax=Mycena metata TaxID=1033252 RepID=A0AAD7HRT8_9AGAR|nr:hypothetical protein B0H16DRAFT_1735422 [Mycena metata]
MPLRGHSTFVDWDYRFRGNIPFMPRASQALSRLFGSAIYHEYVMLALLFRFPAVVFGYHAYRNCVTPPRRHLNLD